MAINAHTQWANLEPQRALLPVATTRMLAAWIEMGDAVVAGIHERTARDEDRIRPTIELVLAVRVALGNLRASIRSERAIYPELPATLEAQILGMADEIGRRKAPKPEVGPPEEDPVTASPHTDETSSAEEPAAETVSWWHPDRTPQDVPAGSIRAPDHPSSRATAPPPTTVACEHPS